MAYWTLSDFKTKLDKELDLENDILIQPTEFVGYVNDGVREVVAEMINLGVDDMYYQTKAYLPVTANTPQYSLPAKILANKIVEIVYDDSSDVYVLHRIRGLNVYAKMHVMKKYPGQAKPERYMIFNDGTSSGDKIEIIPTPLANSATNLTVYFVRQAEQLSLTDNGTGLIDCPEEFIQFLVAFVKVKCLTKEVGHPMLQVAMQDEDRQRKLLRETLSGQVQDSDNTIPPDMSHYEESV